MKNPDVKLRSLQTSDKYQIASLANNKKIWDNVRDGLNHPYTLENAEDFIQRQALSDAEEVFAIESNGSVCGLIGLILQKDVYRNSAEIGYWLGEPYWAKGIATIAVGKIVRVAFDDLKLVRVYASAFEYNMGSMRVLEKNGFLKEGIAKKAVYKNDKYWDEHRYALLNSY